jgi:hypothetical protein
VSQLTLDAAVHVQVLDVLVTPTVPAPANDVKLAVVVDSVNPHDAGESAD